MTKYIEDSVDDYLRIEKASPPYEGLVVGAIQRDDEGVMHHAIVGPIDPHKLIEAIQEEAATISAEKITADTYTPPVDPYARAVKSYEEAVGARSRDHFDYLGNGTPSEADEAEDQGSERARRELEEMERQRAEEQDAHQHLAEHWSRRMDVVQRALTMIPAPAKRGGMMAAFAGEETDQTALVEKALKIARFAADEEREIPGVDK